MAGVSVRVPRAMTGPAHLTVLDKQQPDLIIRTRVVLSVPAREVAFKDSCHFIAVGNHAQLRNPMNYGLGILSVVSSWRSLGFGYTQNMGYRMNPSLLLLFWFPVPAKKLCLGCTGRRVAATV